jgi:hypothetical protein
MAGALRDFFNLNRNKESKETYWTCPKCRTQNPLGSPFCLKCAEDEEKLGSDPEKVHLETDNNPLTNTLVQALNLYLHVAQIPSREVAEEARKHGIVINAPQEIALVPVKELDHLADQFVNANRLRATGSGALMGFPGGALMLATIPADISALAYYSFRTISGIAQCYGSETRSEEGRTIALLLFAGASGIESINVAGSQVLLSSLTKNVLTKPYRDLIMKRIVQEIAKDLGMGIARQGAARLVPVLGSVIGGTANYLFISNVAERAKTYYRMKLLELRAMQDRTPRLPAPVPALPQGRAKQQTLPQPRFDEPGEDNPI